MVSIFLTMAAALIGLTTLGPIMTGQTIPGRYVLELSGEPAAARIPARSAEFLSRRIGVRQSQAAARADIAARGGTVIESMDTVVNALIVEIPEGRSAELMQVPGAIKVHEVRKVRKLLNRALPLHKVNDAWTLLPLGQNGAGAGMKIAIIDTGVDVNNPVFSDPLPALDGFPKLLYETDRKYTNTKVIVARNYTRLYRTGSEPDADDHDGHGTGTATVAGGSEAASPYGTLSGVAPKAYIGNYKVLGPDGGSSDVIAKAIDDAVADGMDVINLSVGGIVMSYSDIDLSEIGMAAIERAAKAGVLVAVAAGNEGPGAGTIADYASAPDAITMGAIHNDRSLGYAVTLDGAGTYEAFSGGSDPGQIVGGTLFDATVVDATGLACASLPGGSVVGKVVLVMRGTCTFQTKLTNAAAAGARAAIVYNNPGGATFSSGVSVGTATLPALFVNEAAGAALKSRAAQSDAAQVALDFTGTTPFQSRTDVTYFSSRGPSVGSALKPDLVAVGEEIVTGAQNTYSGGDSYSANGFIDTAGTSFSAPLAAGAAAVLKAARPGLTGQQYRSLLINSAMPATVTEGADATVSQAGAGMMNLAAAVSGTVAAYPTSLSFGTGATVSSSLTLTLSNVGPVSDTFTVRAAPVAGSPSPAVSMEMVQLEPNASRQLTVKLDASGLAAGEYHGYLLVSGTANSTVARIPYWFASPGSAPAGLSVLYQDWYEAQRSSASGAVVFRVVDAAGLPYAGPLLPAVTASGSGSVRRTYRAGTIPGTYAVDIRTGTSSMTLSIAVGGVTESVVIPVY